MRYLADMLNWRVTRAISTGIGSQASPEILADLAITDVTLLCDIDSVRASLTSRGSISQLSDIYSRHIAPISAGFSLGCSSDSVSPFSIKQGILDAMEQGTVRWYNDAKGFGYISRRNGEIVFVHSSAVRSLGFSSLRKGQAVRFSVVNGSKGLQAESVTLL